MSEHKDYVPAGVVRVSEIVGGPPNSLSDAVRNAVKAATETVRGIGGVEVVSSNADVDENGNLSLYKVNCKIAFVMERQSGQADPGRASVEGGTQDQSGLNY